MLTKARKMSFALPMAILTMLAIVDCSSAIPANPTPVPTPTPDMELLSDEVVREMLLLYHIILHPDYEAAARNRVAQMQAQEGVTFSSGVMDAALSHYIDYAGLYLALQCHNGIEASPSGFRKFTEGLLFIETQDGTDAAMAKAKDTIRQIISRAQARKQLGLSPIKEPCERPYIAPQSAAEAELAMALILAYFEPTLAPGLRSNAFPVIKKISAQWFSKNDVQGIGFLEWYCGRAVGECD